MESGGLQNWRFFARAVRPFKEAILTQSSRMTLSGFGALLLLPSFKRSSVFDADRAALAKESGCKGSKKLPWLTLEDGNANSDGLETESCVA
jgi:hypothetical protein